MINNYSSPSANNTERREEAVCSVPPSQDERDQSEKGRGVRINPGEPFEMKRLDFVWRPSAQRSKSLHVLGSRKWLFLTGGFKRLRVCVNEGNKASLYRCLLSAALVVTEDESTETKRKTNTTPAAALQIGCIIIKGIDPDSPRISRKGRVESHRPP